MNLRAEPRSSSSAAASPSGVADAIVPEHAQRELSRLRVLLAARRGWRFWSVDFWTACRAGDLSRRIAELEAIDGAARKRLDATPPAAIWSSDENGIVCRLLPLTPAEHKSLIRESVADRTDIVLCFRPA